MTVPISASDFNPRDQLVPHIVDHYARVQPEDVYAEYPRNVSSLEDGYQAITYKALANAIDGIAHWLVKQLGPGHGETLTYVGPNDLRYPALVLGAVKAGYCMFLTSPRNSALAHQTLLEKLECTRLVAPVPRPPPAAAILEAVPSLEVYDVPSVEELLTTEYPHFQYAKTYPDAAREPLAIIHTSGSTGIPKPIVWTHDTAVKHMHMQVLEPPAGYESQHQWGFGKRMYMMMPPFHAAGLGHFLFVTMHVGITLVLPASGGLPTAAGMVASRKQTPFEVAFVAPSIVSELAQSPELLDFARNHVEYIAYCGGDLPQAIGDTVAAQIKLVSQYGATEMGFINSIHSKTDRDSRKDWRYINFHPEVGIELQHVSGDEYEMVQVRSPHRERHQFPFTIFPDRQEYHTSDLMVPHPTKPGLWRTTARIDDVIVFLNGEKTNPVSMEQYIVSANPEVTGALVTGAQRFQAALLVELGRAEAGSLGVSERAAMIEKLWPSIQHANAECPAHARIAKSHILFTTPEKPMLRAGKGTVQRAGTVLLYTQELEALYADAEKLAQHDAGEIVGPGSVEDAVQVAEYIRASILNITGWDAEKLSDTENWFNLGLDSLQAITATRVLKQGLNLPDLTPNLIYLHPSVTELTSAVQQLHQQGRMSTEQQQQALLAERDQLLQELISQVEQPSHAAADEPSADASTSPKAHTVILTGSTGQLGTYILDALLKNPSVAHIHCLNRDESAAERQHKRLAAYGLTSLTDSTSTQTRVSFWTTDLSKTDLGLAPHDLAQLQQTATLIIHNAWTVNFNLSLTSFKPHLQGVVNLINFAAHSAQTPHLFFLSSISSTMGHHTESGLTPETVIHTAVPGPNGYANSKYIAEHLLGHAAQQQPQMGPSFAFARVGQVCGAVRSPGLWNPAEWFPSLVRSALHLRALPESLGRAPLDQVDWVPIDLLAEVLVDLAVLGGSPATIGSVSTSSTESRLKVYHPVNLHPQPWPTTIRPAVAEALLALRPDEPIQDIDTIPLREWVMRVRRNIEKASVGRNGVKKGSGLAEKELQVLLERNPAAKLLEFFETLADEQTAGPENALETVRTAAVSARLHEVSGVQAEWVRKWVGEWFGVA
ncbi:NRPS-like enzyme [Aspergillus homomorphus CBS 101889]|uniref:NRPS-like enzyme n=1 Tax=Aspergillus homomorphus (strain CBS 101889) TaxID=1450537 RepID=A0A395HQJ2_ASPHC|nr:NRPS-like enzyme [Aspergillus homomorphus CBS 101889]RAL08514.1 NRPS-like enzyme [Aspergillus homomorphus CBS 101889]